VRTKSRVRGQGAERGDKGGGLCLLTGAREHADRRDEREKRREGGDRGGEVGARGAGERGGRAHGGKGGCGRVRGGECCENGGAAEGGTW